MGWKEDFERCNHFKQVSNRFCWLVKLSGLSLQYAPTISSIDCVNVTLETLLAVLETRMWF